MKKKITVCAVCAAAVCVGFFIWSRLASPTRIAFVNWQAIPLGQISAANDSRHIKLEELSVEHLDRARRFDMVFVNGMGLRITEPQRQMLLDAAKSGTPVMTSMATNPQNRISSVDSLDSGFLRRYMVGGRHNYRNMLRYVRRFVDGKRLFAALPDDPVAASSSLLYYPSAEDELQFASVAEYEQWLKRQGKWRGSAPRIILTGQMGVADSLVAGLEAAGIVAYPVNAVQTFIAEGHADSVSVSAVVNMAHGRLGDAVVRWLEARNVPLFAPLNANRGYDEWMADRMGMSGGFLSQSVVTPEIDGAIRPFTLFAHFTGHDGLPCVEAVPDRLDEFVGTVSNHIALQRKPNRDKKVAVFYFKGPGQSALVAEGMEVAPSLYNLLLRLKTEGYRVEGLPSDAAAFGRQIERYGRIFNGYAVGAKADFVRTCNPEIISREEYDRWCGRSFSADMRSRIDAVDGEFPGHGLHDGNGRLALARLQFGNVVLIPQPAAGLGDDDFKIVHGTDAAPPHNYIAAYLWARYGFGADALIHFGAHGSLEFTPRKQAALGSGDWPDRLVGTMPHIYLYSTSNVGEAMTAKRRSYAEIVNHLTPPFMESRVRGIYKNLTDAVANYNRSTTAAEQLRAAGLVKRHTLELGIHRELRIDSIRAFTAADIARIEAFAEELANEKITGAHYVLGEPYPEQQIRSTAEAVAVDPADREKYCEALRQSPEKELSSLVNALGGGFVSPTSGGDPIQNPDVLPTGRNMFAVDAERTPSAAAWEKGRGLAENTIAMYRRAHNDSIPRKVSYTLWSSEFIETEGATIAQVLYMLGVEPVRDPFGRITDIRLIPSEKLGRPRIDVVVQTSGQLRDLAASRLFLISRAVKMAAESEDDRFPNYVADGVVATERHLVDNGVPPKEARALSASRVFGGAGGSYGSGIRSMVEAGDRWEGTDEIAATYIRNMGASYGSEAEWEQLHDCLFEAALTRTDVVVQPRQSNTWGALSLDHVYEFMGGMNLAVRNVTGKEPDAYLSDYRNRNRARMQELKEAVGIESRTTILNPAYIKERMKGGAGDAAALTDAVRNTYGWNVMKPDVIDNELWNDIYDTYIADRHGLGTKDHFRAANPAALQEMTAVMLETVRKGMWRASEAQVAAMAELHTDLIDEFGAACSEFVCDNARLRGFIASRVAPAASGEYNSAVARVRDENISAADGITMRREEVNGTRTAVNRVNGIAAGVVVLAAVVGLTALVRRRKKSAE